MATAPMERPWAGGEKERTERKGQTPRRKGKPRRRAGLGGAQGHARGWPRGGGGNGKTPPEHQPRKGGEGHEQRHNPERKESDRQHDKIIKKI